jgi:HEAT repeat protein
VLWIAMVAFAATLTLAAAPTHAQQGARATDSFEQLMEDFIHFVRIDDMEVAADVGRVILSKGLTDREFAAAIDDANKLRDFEDALGKALKHAQLEPIVAQMDRLYHDGKKAEARDPQEISRNIGLLTQGLRANRIAHERLVNASEYAMVQLLEAYRNPNASALRTEVESVMISMGPGAVIPLCTALPHMMPPEQERVARVLGIIRYPTALPFLTELMYKTNVENVRDECERAIAQIWDGSGDLDASAQFERLAEGYFDERSELTSFPGEENQLLWSYDTGLRFNTIATPVFHEAMCMRYAERSMGLREEDNRDAVALWAAANFKRELETPDAYDNPAYPADRRDAMYYAVSFGAEIDQAVLERAINSSNTQLARRAIAALAQTAGGSSLWTGADGGPAPLLAALQYPDRRVQYEAALVLGAAQPQVSFPGAERVVPTLASAVRDVSDRYALIITPDREAYTELRGLVTQLGYAPMAHATDINAAAQGLADVPGVDLLIVDTTTAESAEDTVTNARYAPKLAVVPTLVLSSPEGVIDLSRTYAADRLVSVRQRAITPEMMKNAITGLVEKAAGGAIGADEARAYTAQSLGVLRDLAIAGNQVLDASEAVRPLIGALGDASGQTQLRIAEVLAWSPQSRAQIAVMDAALDATGDQQARLLDTVAGSARRYGNLLESRQVDRLVDLSRFAADVEATAAAALVGSLNLPNRRLVPLILEDDTDQIGQR